MIAFGELKMIDEEEIVAYFKLLYRHRHSP